MVGNIYLLVCDDEMCSLWGLSTNLEVEDLRSLPSEVRIIATEVTVGSGLLQDWAAQVQVTDDSSWAKIEVVLDDLSDLQVSLSGADNTGAIGINEDGQWVGDTDGVGQLNEDTVGQTSRDDGLGDPTGSVGSRAIDLGGILTREGSTTVGTPTTIGINDDLAASQTSITVWTTDDEAARWVQVVDGLVVEVLSRDDRLDDVLKQLSLDLILSDVLTVLGGDDDGVDTDWDWATVLKSVLAGDLGLAVRSNPWAGTVLADLGQSGTDGCGKLVSKRHHTLGLISGITKHDTLVTSTNIFQLLGIDGLGDIRGLLLDSDDDVAGSVVQTLGNIVVTDFLQGLTDDLLVVDGSRGSDLTEDHNHASLGAGLASNTGGRILTDAGIKDSIRDLVTDLI